MRLSELIQLLQDVAENYEDVDPMIQLATQPHWPLAYRVAGVATSDDVAEGDSGSHYDEPIVFIVEGGQVGYTDSGLWDAARN